MSPRLPFLTLDRVKENQDEIIQAENKKENVEHEQPKDENEVVSPDNTLHSEEKSSSFWHLQQQQQQKRNIHSPTFGSVKNFVSSKQQQQHKSPKSKSFFRNGNPQLLQFPTDHRNLHRRLLFNRSIDAEIRSPSSSSRLSSVLVSPRRSLLTSKKISQNSSVGYVIER